MRPLFLLMLTGCFQPYAELSELDFTEIPFDNPYVASPDAVISAFDTTLDCPDGTDARFFAAYRSSLTDRAPVAVVLHSGAFDYVVAPDPTGYLNGQHYREESRLGQNWAVAKIWETLGMNPGVVDASEINSGTMPAALVDAGFLVLIPGNCWGDLWHNEQGYQDSQYEVEGFDRNGRAFAFNMIRLTIESTFAAEQGFSVPMAPDPTRLFLVGLGDGGRGVAEVLTHDNLPPVQGVLIDSSAENLSVYLDEPDTFGAEVDGISRIFREENLANVDDWSIASIDAALLPPQVAMVWSSADPRVPLGASQPAADRLSSVPGTWVYDTGRAEHVFTNANLTLAQEAVAYLQTGTLPPSFQ